MIKIDATGRLAFQPELRVVGNNFQVCEFRLLASRWKKGAEVTEAVTFFCFGEEAVRFCETTEKGQEITATGVQETDTFNDRAGVEKTVVKYRLTWWHAGRKPFRPNDQHGSNNGSSRQRNYQGDGQQASSSRPATGGQGRSNYQDRQASGNAMDPHPGQYERDDGHSYQNMASPSGGDQHREDGFPPDDQFL